MLPVAFYAPLKHPNHPVPSGDRRIARLLLKALSEAGFAPSVASTFRSFDGAGDSTRQAEIEHGAAHETEQLLERYAHSEPKPQCWFTYHLYYKAPDFLGPRIARALQIPYVVAEASHAPKRLKGPWSRFSERTLESIQAADRVFVMSNRDWEMLAEAKGDRRALVELTPFLDIDRDLASQQKSPKTNTGPVRLITVAMMRAGDKLSSYRLLAEALRQLPESLDWTLEIIGDGPVRSEVEASFKAVQRRVMFLGQLNNPNLIQQHLAKADLMVWPGIGEAYGMAYLEAQAVGTPCAALQLLGVSTVVEQGVSGVLADPPTAEAYAMLLGTLLADRDRLQALGQTVCQQVEVRHSLTKAASTLKTHLMPLIESATQKASLQ